MWRLRVMAESGNQLLQFLSSRTSLSWGNFKKLYNYYGNQIFSQSPERYVSSRQTLVRSWEALGFCDFIFEDNNARVNICDPSIVILPTPTKSYYLEAILCGSRNLELVRKLKKAAIQQKVKVYEPLESNNETSFLLPNRISLEAESLDQLKKIAQTLDIYFSCIPLAWQLVNYIGSINDYIEQLVWETNFPLNWECETFNAQSYGFIQSSNLNEVLVRYKNPITSQWQFYILSGDQRALVNGDYGRYIAIQKAHQNVIAYDANKECLITKMFLPLPKLYARSLALCSGFYPQSKNLSQLNNMTDDKYLVWERIPENFAQIIAMKLGQELKPVKL